MPMIRRAEAEDAKVLADLAIHLWADNDPQDLEAEFRRLAKNDEAACFITCVDGIHLLELDHIHPNFWDYNE